jgi:hypothetical protein
VVQDAVFLATAATVVLVVVHETLVEQESLVKEIMVVHLVVTWVQAAAVLVVLVVLVQVERRVLVV